MSGPVSVYEGWRKKGHIPFGLDVPFLLFAHKCWVHKVSVPINIISKQKMSFQEQRPEGHASPVSEDLSIKLSLSAYIICKLSLGSGLDIKSPQHQVLSCFRRKRALVVSARAWSRHKEPLRAPKHRKQHDPDQCGIISEGTHSLPLRTWPRVAICARQLRRTSASSSFSGHISSCADWSLCRLQALRLHALLTSRSRAGSLKYQCYKCQ